jgi:hypothetical protein
VIPSPVSPAMLEKAARLVDSGAARITRDYGDGRVIAEVISSETHVVLRSGRGKFTCSCAFADYRNEGVCSHIGALRILLSERR